METSKIELSDGTYDVNDYTNDAMVVIGEIKLAGIQIEGSSYFPYYDLMEKFFVESKCNLKDSPKIPQYISYAYNNIQEFIKFLTY